MTLPLIHFILPSVSVLMIDTALTFLFSDAIKFTIPELDQVHAHLSFMKERILFGFSGQ